MPRATIGNGTAAS